MNLGDLSNLANTHGKSSNVSTVLNIAASVMDHNLFNSLLQQPPPLPYISRIDSNINNELPIPNQQQLLQCENNANNIPIQNTSSHSHSPNKKRKINGKQRHIEAEIITPEEHELNIKDSPAYYLGLFIDNNIISWLISETSSPNSHLKNFQPVSDEEMRCFVAILYLSGYVDVPRRRMLWERTPDSHCPLVSNAMQRDRFEAIFTALHIADGLKDDSSRYLKIRPLIDLLNERFLRHAPKDEQHSIAECLIPTNSRHSNSKMAVKHLKVWCGCIKSGYCVWFDPSQIQNTADKFNQLYFGRSIILNYANMIQRYQPSNYNLLYENSYSDMPLICELQRLGIQGSSADRDKSGCLLNPALGGVDRMDSNVNLYRISVRGKKCYSALISYALDVALHNAWQLYKIADGEKKQLDLLGFRRNIVIYYLQHYAKPILGHRGGRPAKIRPRGKRPPPSDARFDGIRHYVIPQEKQTRCAKCTAKTTTRCQKCDVGVHVKCFVDYHQRPREIPEQNT